MTWNYPKLPKSKNQNLPLSYGGARRERVLRGRVALIAGASSQRIPLSRLLWVLSCSKKVPRRRHRTRTRKRLRLRQFSSFFDEEWEGALHHKTGHAKTAISPLRFATVEMTYFFFKHKFSNCRDNPITTKIFHFLHTPRQILFRFLMQASPICRKRCCPSRFPFTF